MSSEERIKLNFYGGINGIGNIILLEDLKYETKILLDFGANTKKLIRYPSNLDEIINANILPQEKDFPIKNLYSKNFLFEKGLTKSERDRECADKSDPESDLDGVLISHAHRDHYYGLPFLNRNIPIFIGEYTKKILDAKSKASAVSVDNYYTGLNWRTFRTGDTIDIKGVKIYPVHVDHSIPAAYGFIIHTSAGLVVYSGDFRMHGPLKFMTFDLIRKVNELSKGNEQFENEDNERFIKVIALICEGTFVHKASIESERRVKRDLKILTRDIPFDYFIVKYNLADWDRFRTFVEITKQIGWKFIITEKAAYFYHILNTDENWMSMRNPNILDEDSILIVEQENKNSFLYGWQKEIRNIFRKNHKEGRFLKLKEIKDLKAKFFLYYIAVEKPYRENLPRYLVGAFISTDIDPYSEEYYDSDLLSQLRRLGFTSYRIQASGHAKPHDIYKFATEINPDKIFPIHSEHPKLFTNLFKNTSINVILPELYSDYFI